MPRPNDRGLRCWFGWLRGVRSTYDKVPSTSESSVQTERSATFCRGMRRQRVSQLPQEMLAQNSYSAPEFRARVAAAKLMNILWAKEPSQVHLDQSLYGAAFVLPQIARSAGWPKELKVLCLKTFLVLLCNYVVQFAILYFIAKEDMVWDIFSGQMYLCDFGKDATSCPDGANCLGPGGTVFTNSRYYSWHQWSARTFARDSMKALFPEELPEIGRYADPGEYGLESNTCRMVCCMLFVVTVLGDLLGSFNLAWLMNRIESSDDLWIDWTPPKPSAWASKAATRSGPKLAFRFAERGSKDGLLGDSRVPADFVQGGRFQRRRPKEEELRRRSFTVEELAALASLAGSGLQAVKAQVADGQGMAVHLTSALNAARKLGQAEKVLMKAILEPSEPDEPLGIGPELIQAFGLVPKVRVPEDGQALANLSDVPPPPPSTAVPSTFTSPPPPPPAPGDLANLVPKKRTVPLEEWPSPSADAVQQMLERFPQLDGHCRGSLMNLPPQFALAILWDMDAKGGPEEIRDPQGFVFSAAQTLLRLPMPMGGCAPAVPPGAPLAPAAGLGLPVPTFVGAT